MKKKHMAEIELEAEILQLEKELQHSGSKELYIKKKKSLQFTRLQYLPELCLLENFTVIDGLWK